MPNSDSNKYELIDPKQEEKLAVKSKKSAFEAELVKRQKEEKSRRSRRLLRQFLGLALSTLVIIGIVSVIRSAVSMVNSLVYNETEIQEYQTLITPFVLFDVVPFDSPDSLPKNTVRTVCMWGYLYEIGFSSPTIQRTNQGAAIVPVEDLERYAARLFGASFEFDEHTTFNGDPDNMEYVYDAEINAFIMPITSNTSSYDFKVEEVKNEGNGIRRFTVCYYEPQMLTVGDPIPVKYMDYMFQRSGGRYYLSSLRPNEEKTLALLTDSSASSVIDVSSDESSVSILETIPSAAPDTNTENSSDESASEDSSQSVGGTFPNFSFLTLAAL